MPTTDLSTSTEPRITAAAHVLAEVAATAQRHGAPLLVIGATARDILAATLSAAPPERATADVDVAVAVPSWEAFAALTRDLERTGRREHTFVVGGIPVDVVPFGDLESPARTVEWADGARMGTLGLREAYAASLAVTLPGPAHVRVPTVAGLVALKLSAWRDRRLETRRDAVDLRTLLGWYSEGTHLDDLYTDDIALLERHDFDPEPAAAHRLGRHVADVLGPAVTPVLAPPRPRRTGPARRRHADRRPRPRSPAAGPARGHGRSGRTGDATPAGVSRTRAFSLVTGCCTFNDLV